MGPLTEGKVGLGDTCQASCSSPHCLPSTPCLLPIAQRPHAPPTAALPFTRIISVGLASALRLD